MAGAHRPVIAEVLKTSLSITLKELREKRKEKRVEKQRKNQTTTYRISVGRVGKNVIDL